MRILSAYEVTDYPANRVRVCAAGSVLLKNLTFRRMDIKELKRFLDSRVVLYEQPGFIEKDPVLIPHSFQKKQDIEISGLFAAVLAWGNRTTIINNCRRLMQWMDNDPYHFIIHHKETDLVSFLHFAHRTFNATDLLYFISFLRHHYERFPSLEDAFVPARHYTDDTVEQAACTLS